MQYVHIKNGVDVEMKLRNPVLEILSYQEVVVYIHMDYSLRRYLTGKQYKPTL